MGEGERRAGTAGGTALAFAIAAAAAVGAAPASAATMCSFDAATHVLTVDGDPDLGSNVRASPTEIVVNHLTGTGSTAVDCSGPDATPANTDTVVVDHADAEATTLSVNHPSGFTPGFTDEGMFSADEVEIEADLGPGVDEFHIADAGLAEPNNWILGTLGVNWNPVGFFDDRDITLSGAETYSVVPGSGKNIFTAQGSPVAGGPVTSPLTYSGGVDRDKVTGGNGPDDVIGYFGADVLRGAAGADLLDGDAPPGPDKDRLIGGPGIDRLKAKDGAPDKQLDCGPGDNAEEKVSRDPKKDPKPKSC